MTKVQFYDRVDDQKLKFAVIVTKTNGHWVFCKHKDRNTLEVPGGHREPGEDILATAKRELFEETGAIDFSIEPVCVYSVTASWNFDGQETFGMLFYADVKSFEKELHSEIERIVIQDDLPTEWTYPEIQPLLMREIQKRRTMIIPVDSSNIHDAAVIHSVSWQESHRSFCNEGFIALHTPEHQEEYLLQKMNTGSRIFMLIHQNPIGIVSLKDNLIEDLYVLPDYQNRGYGSMLLRYAISQSNGKPTLWILENNTRAQRLYQRVGFRQTGNRNIITDGLDEIEFTLNVLIEEVSLTDDVLAELISLSKDWEAENSCYGYRANQREDIEGNRVFLARDHGRTVGYLFGKCFQSENMKSIMPEGSSCFEVEEVYVVPSKRSTGIGKALFEFASDAVQEEAEYITLSTATKNWKAIFHFYLDELDMTFWSARLFKRIRKGGE